MQKTILDKFINRYYLAGASPSVSWVIENNTLKTQFISDDKNVLGQVELLDFSELDDATVSIYDTAQLKSLLSVLDKEVSLSYGKQGTKLTSIKMGDKATKVTFVLADEKVIPRVPALKQLPDFDLVLKIDKSFSDTFIRAKGALPDVDTFAIMSDGKKSPEVVIGYSSLNTNRVTLKADADNNAETDAISFSAKYLKEILSANKDATSGTLSVSSKGLALAEFEIEGFTAKYYLVQIATAA